MNRVFSVYRVGVMLVAVRVLAIPANTSAAERPYFASGTAQFVSPNDFVGTGRATHLGFYTEVGNVSFTPTIDPTVFQIDGWATYTAANDAQLKAVVTGS